ncbi:uncharacterized protein LOC105831125 isoform X2 [Monomorium pharaonis]|uniref:uncharacterized protein LOC105831125 isoform X2 n=1 Tax=Monomorium pharaonis TaxID=307658 RepID=UPI001746EFC5|nr:uncharacterized protein LOC105831125 isoform X2 [Monomorium pharaonis]
MIRKVRCHVVLIVALLASAHLAMGDPNWISDFTSNINAMTQNLQQQIHQYTQDLQQQIQQSVQPALEQAYKTIENLPKDSHGHIITNNNGNVISISSVNGHSKTVLSGWTNGEPYVRIIEERRDGNYLYHNETSYNPQTNATESIRWRLDLATPGAKPEIITE